MPTSKSAPVPLIESRIFLIRGQKVLLDRLRREVAITKRNTSRYNIGGSRRCLLLARGSRHCPRSCPANGTFETPRIMAELAQAANSSRFRNHSPTDRRSSQPAGAAPNPIE